ncbi:MAG: CBS domain-containing protein [Candidatus Hodarchaeota archaeon]
MGLSGKEYFVKDLVINDEYGIIDSNATIQQAAKKMKEIGVPDLVVIEGEKVLGVIADFDIVQNVVSEGKDGKSENVISTMYKIEPVNLDTPVSEAFTRMRDLRVNVIPVVDNGKLVGVCSIQDCWSYIPDVVVDEVGLIPVSNTRVAEFWFASASSLTAFVLGIILPLAGILGFFIANQEDVMSLLGLADVRGGSLIFYLFQAHGTDFFVPIINLASKSGGIWIAVVIFGILTLIFGFLGLFSIIYTSYASVRNIKTGYIIRVIIPILMVVFLVFLWILFGIGFATASQPVIVTVDPLGLTLSIVSMLLFIAAINRDYIFRQKEPISSKETEVPK